MKKFIIFTVIYTALNSAVFSQTKIPEFKTSDVEIRFTKFLNGCMADPANTVGNELVYKLKGQVFSDEEGNIPLISEGFSGKTNQATPWETLSEIVAAYQKKDVKKIKSLYNKSSQAKVSSVFEGENAQNALSTLSQCGSVKVLMGFEYNDGYYAIVETENLGINSNYFVLEKGKYKLSVLTDKNPASWNLALYWKFRPKPFLTPLSISKPDSISISEVKNMIFGLSMQRNWIIIFQDKIGEPVLVYAQDGGYNDNDNKWQQVSILFNADKLINKGNKTLYVIESNYPIQVVNENMFEKALKFQLKVY